MKLFFSTNSDKNYITKANFVFVIDFYWYLKMLSKNFLHALIDCFSCAHSLCLKAVRQNKEDQHTVFEYRDVEKWNWEKRFNKKKII